VVVLAAWARAGLTRQLYGLVGDVDEALLALFAVFASGVIQAVLWVHKLPVRVAGLAVGEAFALLAETEVRSLASVSKVSIIAQLARVSSVTLGADTLLDAENHLSGSPRKVVISSGHHHVAQGDTLDTNDG